MYILTVNKSFPCRIQSRYSTCRLEISRLHKLMATWEKVDGESTSMLTGIKRGTHIDKELQMTIMYLIYIRPCLFWLSKEILVSMDSGHNTHHVCTSRDGEFHQELQENPSVFLHCANKWPIYVYIRNHCNRFDWTRMGLCKVSQVFTRQKCWINGEGSMSFEAF